MYKQVKWYIVFENYRKLRKSIDFLIMHTDPFWSGLFLPDIVFQAHLACTAVDLASFLRVHSCKQRSIDRNISLKNVYDWLLRYMDTAEEILLGFTYILQCVSWIGRSHETASNLISVCPNNCSVMPDSSGCTRFCSRWKRLDDCLGDIIDLERYIYINQVYLDNSFKILWML